MVLQHHEGHLNIYLVSARHFGKLYEATDERTEFGSIYRAKGVQYVIHLPGGFDIGASWGERQVASAGYLVLNGEDVYGNKVETFKATYAVVA